MKILFNDETILVCGAANLCACFDECLVKTKTSNNIFSLNECEQDCCGSANRFFHYASRDDNGIMQFNKIGTCPVDTGIINGKYAFEYPKPDYL